MLIDLNNYRFDRALELECEDPDEAIALYRTILRSGGEPRAESAINLSRLTLRIADAREATRIAPEHPIAWYNLGCTLADYEQWGAAIEAYERCLELDPECANARLNLNAIRQSGAAWG